MKLTTAEVDHIAALARLELAEDEKEVFGRQLSSILEYVDILAKAPTEGVEPMNHIVEMHNVFGADEVAACGAAVRDALVAAFPERHDALLKVKAVFG